VGIIEAVALFFEGARGFWEDSTMTGETIEAADGQTAIGIGFIEEIPANVTVN